MNIYKEWKATLLPGSFKKIRNGIRKSGAGAASNVEAVDKRNRWKINFPFHSEKE